MVSKTKKLIAGISILILLIIIGLIYILLPHELREQLNINLGLSRFWNIFIGITIIIIGIALFLLTLLTSALKKVSKIGRKYWYFFVLWDIFKWIVIVILGLIVITGGVQVGQSIFG